MTTLENTFLYLIRHYDRKLTGDNLNLYNTALSILSSQWYTRRFFFSLNLKENAPIAFLDNSKIEMITYLLNIANGLLLHYYHHRHLIAHITIESNRYWLCNRCLGTGFECSCYPLDIPVLVVGINPIEINPYIDTRSIITRITFIEDDKLQNFKDLIPIYNYLFWILTNFVNHFMITDDLKLLILKTMIPSF